MIRIVLVLLSFYVSIVASPVVDSKSTEIVDAYSRYFYGPETSGFNTDYPVWKIKEGSYIPK